MSSLIEVFWIEKYLTFSQAHDDTLKSTDCLFLAEYALRGDVSDADRFEAHLFRWGDGIFVAGLDGVHRFAVSAGGE